MSVRDVLIIGAGPSGLSAAIAAKQRAEEALKDSSGHITQAQALAELARAAAQLKVLERLRKIRG